MNTTAIDTSSKNYDSFNKYMRQINFLLSCTGLLFNFFLIIILLIIGRRQCATYFLLILMTICDFLYCTVYVSIALTVDQYINIINHEILCPLSFFLTPFTFTGSTLLLFICLIHFITNYVRRYDTVLGQIGGPLSIVFVLAFLIIRGVLGSTSVELIILDPNVPHARVCTIDMNTPPIVATVQHINHIFAEVTDILVYIGWIIVLIIYLINLICCKKSSLCTQTELNTSSSMPKPLSFASLLVHNNNIINHEQNTLSMTLELSDILNLTNEIILTNKQRHHDVSLIIISTSIISVIFYLPIMISKYSTMYSVYREQTFLTANQEFFLQLLQPTAHLFCLSIRFLPYLIFDKRIHLLINQLIGIKCMKIQRRKTLSRRRRHQIKQKYIFHCQCYRRPQIRDFNNHNEGEQ
ncbi:unnamed protein product [Adineta steineri]|uniref:G-protein coupled receptors family 1 profile domain-containing protein n=1 Tax=Adineta steineri TaxID=433720 RepID=A0A813RAI8_9BILA|nr:unnamed protein product [Adineta steineri]